MYFYRVQCNFNIKCKMGKPCTYSAFYLKFACNRGNCSKVSRENLELLQEVLQKYIYIYTYIKNNPSVKKKEEANPNISLNIASAWRNNKKCYKNSEVKDTLICMNSFKKKFITSFMVWVTAPQCTAHYAHQFSQKATGDIGRRRYSCGGQCQGFT